MAGKEFNHDQEQAPSFRYNEDDERQGDSHGQGIGYGIFCASFPVPVADQSSHPRCV